VLTKSQTKSIKEKRHLVASISTNQKNVVYKSLLFNQMSTSILPVESLLKEMVIRVVEFSSGVYKKLKDFCLSKGND
jgi:hypothetical protein